MILLLAQMMLLSTPEPLPKDAPPAAPIERRQLRESPESLFAALTVGDRKAALDALGFEWMQGQFYGAAALHALNLDSDDATERFITLDNGVAVMKREGDTWWLLGSFSCCGPSGRAAEPFAEWKELVWPGTKDLIIHGGGVHGTGVGQTIFTAYRIWHGKLYPVVEMEEQSYNLRETNTTAVRIPSPGRLTAGRTTRIGQRQIFSCKAYKWNVAKFAFQPAREKKDECSQ